MDKMIKVRILGAAISAISGLLFGAVVWALSPSSASGTTARDCGVSWACFERAVDRNSPATIHVSMPSGAGGQKTPSQMLVRAADFNAASATVYLSLGGAAGSCRIARPSLRAIVEGASATGTLSAVDFAVAHQCQGNMFSSWWPAAHKAVTSLRAVSVPSDYADCGWSLACLLSHVIARAPAAARTLTVLPLFGLLTTTVSYLRVGGFGRDTATMYVRTDKSAVSFLPGMIQAMKAKGMKDADIRKAEVHANASAASVVGADGSCRFKDAALEKLLRSWYAGAYSTEDWSRAESCTGKMFANWNKGG